MDVIWQAHLRLVAAIVAQGVQDALKNDADALAWVESAGFAHWCEWLGLDAKRARRTIAGRRQTGQALRQGRSGPVARQFSEQELAWAMTAHDNGMSWGKVAAKMGVSHPTLQKHMEAAGYETGRQSRHDKAAPERLIRAARLGGS